MLKVCRMCGVSYEIAITEEQEAELNLPRSQRRNVQDIIPDVSPDLAELFISGICGKCFDSLFSGDSE